MYIMDDSITLFTKTFNLQLLWDVLLDELHVNISDKTLVNNIKMVFDSNITPFTSRINSKTPIMDLNKQFLSQLILAVNKLISKQEPPIKKITIFPEEVIEPYKIEDIHASRQSEFEKEVERKRMEMENFMSPQKPQKLDFSDKNSDGKIKAMDSLIAEKMEQRKLEINQLQFTSNNNHNSDDWLTPKETSVKNNVDTSMRNNRNIGENSIQKNNKLKYLSFDNNNNITLNVTDLDQPTNNNHNKKVTFDDEQPQEPIINIFNKLKRKPEPSVEIFQDNYINEKQYIEQKSMPLPEIKQEEIIRNQTTLKNEAILPTIEIVKQLNELNRKIDNLYLIIDKLTNNFHL